MTLVAVAVCALAALLTMGSADLGAIYAARQQALVAGEAAAVAAADAATWLSDEDPQEQAQALAEANGATLLACDCVEGASSIEVEVATDPQTRFVLAWLGVEVRVRVRARVDDWVPSWSP